MSLVVGAAGLIEFDQYVLKVDGSGRLTLRNRKFLRKITPFQLTKHFKSDISVSPRPSHEPPAVPPPETPLAAIPSEEQPSETPATTQPQPSPSPPAPPADSTPVGLRRSTRTRREPDRLGDKMRFGGKTYEETSSSSIASSLPHCRTRGEEGITEHAPSSLYTPYRSDLIWRPF